MEKIYNFDSNLCDTCYHKEQFPNCQGMELGRPLFANEIPIIKLSSVKEDNIIDCRFYIKGNEYE